MGFMGNIFKKKEPDFGLSDNNLGLEKNDVSLNSGMDQSLGMTNNNEEPKFDSFGNPTPERRYSEPNVNSLSSSQGNQAFQDNNNLSKDIEIIIAKLDSIKSEVTTINHRLEMLERQNNPPGQKKYVW